MTDTIPTRKAMKHLGMAPAAEIESYDSVPWFRRAWFALFPLFVPALIVIALTGDVFIKATRSMKAHSEANVWRYSGVAKAAYIVANLVFVAVVINIAFFG